MEVHSNIMMALSNSACAWLHTVCVTQGMCMQDTLHLTQHMLHAYERVSHGGRVKCVSVQVQHVPRVPGGSSFSSLIYKYNPSLPPTVRAEN